MITHQTLFKRDTQGRIRVWFIEQDGERYRFVTGLKDGARTRSEWTTAVPKSKPTAQAQADFEVAAAYEHCLKRDYFLSEDEVDEPRALFPMLAQKYDDLPFAPGYAQPKLDGMRCIARAHGLFSRQGQPIVSVPHIRQALEPFFEMFPDAILDGELYNHELKDDFEELMSLCRKSKGVDFEKTKVVQYHVYDYPSSPADFGDRYLQVVTHLDDTVQCPLDSIHVVDTVRVEVEGQFLAYAEGWIEDRYEGAMHRLDAPYEAAKRSKALRKYKVTEDAEFPVVRFEEGTGNWAGAAKTAICVLPDGREFGVTVKGKREDAKKLLAGPVPKELTATYKGLTKYGIPRNARVKTFWPEGRNV